MELRCGEKNYFISELTLGDISAFRDHLRARKIGMVRSALAGSPELSSTPLSVIASPVTDEDTATGLKEMASIIFLIHRSVLKKHPDVRIEEIANGVPVSGLRDLEVLMASMTGTKGPGPNPPEAPAKPAP